VHHIYADTELLSARISNHKLKIETGRYSKPITPLVYFRINGKHLLVQNTTVFAMLKIINNLADKSSVSAYI
jgi:hypothetical protein